MQRSTVDLRRLRPILIPLSAANLAAWVYLTRLWPPDFTPRTLFTAAIFVALIVLAEQLAIDLPIPHARITVSVSSAITFAGVLTLGPTLGILVAVVGTLLDDLIDRREPLKILANANNFALQGVVAGPPLLHARRRGIPSGKYAQLSGHAAGSGGFLQLSDRFPRARSLARLRDERLVPLAGDGARSSGRVFGSARAGKPVSHNRSRAPAGPRPHGHPTRRPLPCLSRLPPAPP
ncbi:MAG: hypothetical protein J7450_01915 [Thermomicrobium sp.]|uniref:ECF transporter S component n=1 Tax=Thermomicrobium sp. TaxID=1969469 RepID=UPI001B180192|nr:ECF transporter S component [Thermomicrobium sp.]MBO9358300.1 hypothetical protein [Thermomicrobium sp.]